MKFPSIKSVVEYLLESKTIKVDRNKISKCLNTGESYKGYIFYK